MQGKKPQISKKVLEDWKTASNMPVTEAAVAVANAIRKALPNTPLDDIARGIVAGTNNDVNKAQALANEVNVVLKHQGPKSP